MSLHLGIDPGINGAWAVLDAKGTLLVAADMPVGEDGRVDGEVLRRA